MSNRCRFHGCALAAFAVGLAAFAAEPQPLPQASPFIPAPGAAPALAQAETLEFAGVSVVGKRTLISLHDTKEKRSRWIPVGAKAEGIDVVSYDAAHEQVVLRQNGQLKTLKLRKPTHMTGPVAPVMPVGYGSPNPLPAPMNGPPGSQPPAKPLTLAQQEEEARMFVADMLDIGMQHRKAYEEAQKKAAAEKAAGGSSTTPARAP